MKQAAKTYGEGKKYDFATARVPHAIYGAHGASMPHVPHAIYGNFGHVGSKCDHRARATSSRVRPSAKTSSVCSNAEMGFIESVTRAVLMRMLIRQLRSLGPQMKDTLPHSSEPRRNIA